jgi:hypothetical protein
LILENSLLLYSQQETLDVQLNVGSIHFRGEVAEFYVQTARNGIPFNATIVKAILYYSEGQVSVDLTTNVQHVATGLYRIHYTVPTGAPTGTYVLTVNAQMWYKRICARGTGSKAFLISPTLTSMKALITDIDNNIATVVIPDLGTIKTNLTEIHATVTAIEGNTAIIQTDIGTMTTELSTINARTTRIEDDTTTIETDIGTVEDHISDLNETTYQPTYWFSLAAAILAGLSVVLIAAIIVLRGRAK